MKQTITHRRSKRILRATVEGFIGKPESNPYIILISTPQAPGMIMESIEKEQNSLYYKMFLTYEYGREDHTKYMMISNWNWHVAVQIGPCEDQSRYIGVAGNVYNNESIERAKLLGEKYSKYTDPDNWLKDVPTVMALDPAWGLTSNASKYGVVISQFIDGKVVIIYAAETIANPTFQIWCLRYGDSIISVVIFLT